jgi:hypothetical protein
VLSVDNITYGLIDHAWSHSVAVQAIEQFLATSLLSVVGLLASAAVMRVIPGMKERSTAFMAGLAGAALIIAAPILLAVG